MKTLLFLSVFTLLLWHPVAAAPPPGGNVSFGVFYTSLSPHGQWIECNLGYVWRPAHVSHGWRPYMNGRWVWSDYGWYWVSYEPYGWATYHYGRWYYDDYYGWIWVPDETWGPSWVEWRYDDNYLGWAPLSPYATFNVSVGVTFGHEWSTPYHYWNFVTYHNFSSEHISECVQPVERNERLFGSTRGVVDIRSTDNRIVNRGIDLATIEHRGNIRVRTADVTDRSGGEGERISQNGNRERIEAYRPHLEARMHDQVARPQNVERATRQIGTDLDKSPREKQLDRMRSIEGNSPRNFAPRNDRQVIPNRREGPGAVQNGRAPGQPQEPGNRPGVHNPGQRPDVQRPPQHQQPDRSRIIPRMQRPPAPQRNAPVKQPDHKKDQHDAGHDNGGQRPRPR